MRVRKTIRRVLIRVKQWLQEEEAVPIGVENRFNWIGEALEKLLRDPACAGRCAYIWGVLKGCALAKVLDMRRVSVIEFGVAGGAGLLALEQIAECVEAMLQIRIDVYGFDTGCGLPKPVDYRDCPNLWLDGQFPMGVEALTKRLRRAVLKLGPVGETLPAFLQSGPAPIAFTAIDLDFYSSTKDALRLFEAGHDQLLPRVVCYFDDIIGLTFCEYNGERLAITEFNDEHPMRKICPLHGLKYFVPSRHRQSAWPELLYLAHVFDHPLYSHPEQFRMPMLMDIDGKVRDWRPTKVSSSRIPDVRPGEHT